jgi:hypothetical protein
MCRFRPIREHAAANVGEPHRIQLAVRETFPPKTPAFTSLGQVLAKTDIHETLKPTKSLAGVRALIMASATPLAEPAKFEAEQSTKSTD